MFWVFFFFSHLAKPVSAACHAVPDPPETLPGVGVVCVCVRVSEDQRTAPNVRRQKMGNQQNDSSATVYLLFIPQRLTEHLLCARLCSQCLGDGRELRGGPAFLQLTF